MNAFCPYRAAVILCLRICRHHVATAINNFQPSNFFMHNAKQLLLILCICFWAILIGGIVYSHVVYLPPYLGHLPESNSLIRGDYGLHEENFWMRIHPVIILLSILTLVLNWKLKSRRVLIGAGFGIYVLALVVTALYFVPELKAFAAQDPAVSSAEWKERGAQWLNLSLVRGCFLFAAFVLLLVALTKNLRREDKALAL